MKKVVRRRKANLAKFLKFMRAKYPDVTDDAVFIRAWKEARGMEKVTQ